MLSYPFTPERRLNCSDLSAYGEYWRSVTQVELSLGGIDCRFLGADCFVEAGLSRLLTWISLTSRFNRFGICHCFRSSVLLSGSFTKQCRLGPTLFKQTPKLPGSKNFTMSHVPSCQYLLARLQRFCEFGKEISIVKQMVRRGFGHFDSLNLMYKGVAMRKPIAHVDKTSCKTLCQALPSWWCGVTNSTVGLLKLRRKCSRQQKISTHA